MKIRPRLKVPPFKQTDASRCGPASVKMVLDYYGIIASEDEVAKSCNHTFERGCSNEDMKTALEKYGLSVEIKQDNSFDDVSSWVKKKVPVIVDWFTGGIAPSLRDFPNGHASVVVGIDANNIHIIDPENGKVRSIKKKDFIRVWFDWKNNNQTPNKESLLLRLMIIATKKP